MLYQDFGNFVNKVGSLVADELNWTAERAPDVFVQNVFHIISQCFGLDPLCVVICGHQDVLVTFLGHGQGEGPHEIQAPLLEWLKW